MVTFAWEALYEQAAFLILVVTTLILALTPWLKRITSIPAYSLIALFLICVIATFTLEKIIKNTIADLGGFFNSSNPVDKMDSKTYNSRLFSYEEGGFTISIPSSWRQKKHRSGLTQFERRNGREQLTTLSPTCFHNSEISIPEIINNIKNTNKLQGITTNYQCFRGKQKNYICFITSKKLSVNSMEERWQWLVTNKWQDQSVELDFVFYDQDLQGRQESEYIIRSLQIQPMDSPLPSCINSVDWY